MKPELGADDGKTPFYSSGLKTPSFSAEKQEETSISQCGAVLSALMLKDDLILLGKLGWKYLGGVLSAVWSKSILDNGKEKGLEGEWGNISDFLALEPLQW